MTQESPSTLTLREAAAATGVSLAALRRRSERGSLRTVKRERGGVLTRLVPRSELVRTGLLEHEDTDLVINLRDELDRLTAQLAEQRQLVERVERQHQAEHDAHEHTLATLHEERALTAYAVKRSDDLQADLDAIAAAGPIKALRLRKRLKTTG